MDGLAEQNAGQALWLSAWFTIWISPRATIRQIVSTDPHKFVIGIAWFVGALAALDLSVSGASSAWPAHLPHLPDLGPIGLAAAAFLIGVLSIVGLYGMASLYRWAGEILGGTANIAEVRAAIAWGQVPGLYITSLVVALAALGLSTPTVPPSFSAGSLLEAIAGIWAFVISLQCLGEVHRFSAWRALGAIVLGNLAVIIVAVGVAVALVLAILVGRALL